MSDSFFSRVMKVGAIQRQGIISLLNLLAFSGIGFASTIYFAHSVGASVLGAFFLFMSYYGIMGMFIDGGIGGAAIKRISEGEEQDAYFTAFFVIRSVFIVAVVLVLSIARSLFVDLNNSGLFNWLLIVLIANAITGAVSIGVAGRMKMGIRSTCNTITNISSVIIQVAAIYFGFGAYGLAGGVVAGLFIGGIIEFHFFDLHFAPFKRRHIKSLFVFAFWLFLSSGGAMVFLQADTILIGHFMEYSDVGVYRVVMQFTMVATFTTNALRNILWPSVSQWGKSGEINRVEESLARALSYSLLLALPVLAGGILLGDKLLYYLYGAEFSSGYTALIILLAVQVVNVFQYFFTMYLDALDHPKDSFKVTAISGIANVLLNIIFIPLYGIKGAAIATLLSMIFNVFLARRALSRIISIKVEHSSLKNILMATTAMAVLVGLYRMFIHLSNIWVTLLAVAAGGIIYSFLILKLDKKICNELRDITVKLRLPWPNWL
ncbi:MAG: flippase [Candidatus Methanoperedens sp.]|nr:flippase [Candidatus Methanoperedens sp.]